MSRFDCYPRAIRDLINEYGMKLVEAFMTQSDDVEWLRRNLERMRARA